MNSLSTQMKHDDIRLTVHGMQDLPAISPMSTKLLGVIGDDRLSIHQLADIIRQDVSLGGRIIGLANSAYFGQREPITSVEDAIFKALGLRLTQNMALGIALSGPFSSQVHCATFDMHGFWLKAVLTANLAQGLCKQVRGDLQIDIDMAYLAGLLHELGLLPLVYLYPEQMDELFTRRITQHQHLREVLRKELGTDQHEVGAWLAMNWQIPPAIVDVIAHHAEADYDGEHALLVLLIRCCSRWAILYMEDSIWDRLPEETDLLLEYTGIDRSEMLKVLKQQHVKFGAMESMAHALVES
ncbi:MAG: HDOD domain-containing protein [Gammaproteobacteria bacterium]|nr:HDOD domain-containing protein [Gammaproteobacteria bacterium]